MNLKEIKEIAMRAPQLGAQAEIFVMRSQSLSLQVSDQKLENMDRKNTQGVGIRALVDGRMGFAFSTVLSKESVEYTLRQAIENAKATAPDQFNILPGKNVAIGEKETLADVSFEEKLENLMLAERKAKDYDPRIVKVQRVGYSDSLAEIMIASSEGVEAEYTNSYYSAYVSSQAEEDGNVEMGTSYDVVRDFAKINFRNLGEESADKAVSMLGAKPIASEKLPVILDREVATSVLEIVADILSARAVIKKKSLFENKLGTKVASPLITIIDDGTLQDGVATAIVDDEGVPTQRTVLIDSGILTSYYHNSYTANRMGVASTGNGVRSGPSGTVGCGPTNIYIQPGVTSKEEMIDSLNRGLMITDVMGLHTANPISGDFSLGASGFLIESGKLVRPVRGITIAGNLVDLLSRVVKVGSDLRMYGSSGAPTLLVDGLSIAGE